MPGEPDKDELRKGSGITLPSATASPSDGDPVNEAELSDQVERVVSLLHKLETLYTQTPIKSKPPSNEPLIIDAALDDDELPAELLERYMSPGGEASASPPMAFPGNLPPPLSDAGLSRDGSMGTWSPPPIPSRSREAAGGETDPSFWYKGALRQHESDVKRGPSVLTKVGLGVAAIIAVLLAVPWIVPGAIGPEWRQPFSSVVAGRDTEVADLPPPASPAAETLPSDVAPAVVEPPPPAVAAAPPQIVADPQPASRRPAVVPDAAAGEGDSSGADSATTGAAKEDRWRVSALQAMLEQRAAWSAAKASGEWTGTALTVPVESRSFGQYSEDGPAGLTELAALNTPGIDDSGATGGGVLTCDSAAIDVDQRTVSVNLADGRRAGQQTELTVNAITYRTSFDATGRVAFQAPRLDETPIVRWVLGDGTVCQRTLDRPAGSPLLLVGLFWSGKLDLELEVVEPRSWPGNPIGHITPLQANLDQSHGAGIMNSFGQSGDATRAYVYSVPLDKVGSSGVLNTQVRLVNRSGAGDCGSSAEVFTNNELRYEVYVVRDQGAEGGFTKETNAFAFNVPPCGAAANQQRVERLTVRF